MNVRDYDQFQAMFAEKLRQVTAGRDVTLDNKDTYKHQALTAVVAQCDPQVETCLEAYRIWFAQKKRNQALEQNVDAKEGAELYRRVAHVCWQMLPRRAGKPHTPADGGAPYQERYKQIVDTWDLIPPDALLAELIDARAAQTIGGYRRALMENGYELEPADVTAYQAGKHAWWHVKQRPPTDEEEAQELADKISDRLAGLNKDTLAAFLDLIREAQND